MLSFNHLSVIPHIETTPMVKTFSVEYDQEEPNLPKGKEMSFHTSEPANSTGPLNIQQIYTKTPLIKQKRVRRDEPQLGAIVYTSSIKVLHDYIIQTPRRTFENPAGNFVIIITMPILEEEVDVVASRVLEQLWRYYRMLNVILIFSCRSIEVWTLENKNLKKKISNTEFSIQIPRKSISQSN